MNPRILPGFVLAVVLLVLPAAASAQKITSLNATAKGKGTITSRVDKHNINSIMVILKENGEADFTFYADLQLSATGRWSMGDSLTDGISIQITGGIVSGNSSGSGKLYLLSDGKSIDKLTIDAETTGGGDIKVEFVADKPTN